MKCYFCLTEPDENNSVYLDLLYVSIKTALANTNLDIHVIYDGSKDSVCHSILKSFDIKIIYHSFSHEKYLKNTYSPEFIESNFGHKIPYKKIAGTFMRFDIPFIEKEDDYILYSDIDVMFLKDIEENKLDKPYIISATSEFEKDINKIEYFNAGILYINVKNMKNISNIVFNMLKNGVRNKKGLFDQGYLNQLCFSNVTYLPLEYNWKPYWGYNKNAIIIHLHAMKPGGLVENSGFGMNEDILFSIFNNKLSNISGYIYYIIDYYNWLKKYDREWIDKHITRIIEIYIDKINIFNKINIFKIKNIIRNNKKITLLICAAIYFILFLIVNNIILLSVIKYIL